MNFKQLITIMVFALAFLNTHEAAAISCGDVITTSTTLTHDLYCNSGYYAVEIGADNITLDLNGHTLSGTTDLAGVVVYGKNKVRIKGNGGGIKGFWAGVNSSGSNKLVIEDITFYELKTGVIVASGNEAVIQKNDFIYVESDAVFIANFVEGNKANENAVKNNEFYKVGTGIQICGNDSDYNVLTDNLIWKSKNYGILISRSDNNQISRNEILETEETALRIDDSARNQIKSNELKVGNVGLSINSDSAGACLATGITDSFKNIYQGNHTMGFNTGVTLGTGISANQVYGNQINFNKLYDNNTGIFFNSDTYLNNATSNAFSGTTTTIIDWGSSNSY